MDLSQQMGLNLTSEGPVYAGVDRLKENMEVLMNRTKWVTILGTTLCAGILPLASSAATINQRQHSEQARIHQGVRSGELTRPEARRLEEEQAKIRVDERFARRNGLTAKERERLDKELNKASKDIYKQKHDNQERN
jgi:hypothetical protein